MNGSWIMSIVWMMMLISGSMNCPDKCTCVKKHESDVIIDCTKLGIVIFPPDVSSDESELQHQMMEINAIDLSENEIIQAHFPSTYKSVTRINLAYNEIGTMKNVTISDVDSLKELDLSHNKKLDKLTIDLKSKSLEILTMRNCSIEQVEEGFLQSLPSLKNIDISHNSIPEMGHFVRDDSTDLDTDDQQDFPLTTDQEKYFQLTHLNISHNKLARIHGKDFKYTKIKILDVSHNKLSHLKFTLYLPHLEELYVTDNNLKNLDGLSAPNLLLLDVSGNKIKEINYDFHIKTPKLKTLHITHNNIEKLTKIKSSTILDLDVSYSQVRIIEPDAFSRMERLQRLNLMGNDLTNVHHQLFLNARHLQILLLGDNPWDCDCTSQDFNSLYNLVLFERFYSNGHDLRCFNDGNQTWSDTCKATGEDNDLVLSEKGAFYTLLYLFVTLLCVIMAIACFKWIRNRRQSDAMTFDYDAPAVSDSDYGVESPLNTEGVLRPITEECDEDRPPSFPARKSTPPPNYEAALRLPVLTEEQREMAISTLSLNRTP